MYDTLNIGPCRIDGRVESEASLVHPEIGAAPVHYLTLKVYLHLESMADNKRVTQSNRCTFSYESHADNYGLFSTYFITLEVK